MAIKVVHNSLSEGELIYPASFEALDLDADYFFYLPYNPESWNVRVSPDWSPDNRAGAITDFLQWRGNKPRVIQFKITLAANDFAQRMDDDTYHINMDKLMVVEDVIKKLEDWSMLPTRKTDQPTLVRVTFGDCQYTGSITGFSYSKMRTDHLGNALVADLSFTLTENTL